MGQCRTRRSWVGSLCGERPPSDRARSFAGCMMRRLPVGREGDAWERRWAFGILPQRGAADETLAVPPRVAATVGLSLFGCLRTKWQEALGEGSLVADDDRRRPLWPCNTSSPTPLDPCGPATRARQRRRSRRYRRCCRRRRRRPTSRPSWSYCRSRAAGVSYFREQTGHCPASGSCDLGAPLHQPPCLQAALLPGWALCSGNLPLRSTHTI